MRTVIAAEVIARYVGAYKAYEAATGLSCEVKYLGEGYYRLPGWVLPCEIETVAREAERLEAEVERIELEEEAATESPQERRNRALAGAGCGMPTEALEALGKGGIDTALSLIGEILSYADVERTDWGRRATAFIEPVERAHEAAIEFYAAYDALTPEERAKRAAEEAATDIDLF